MSFPAWTPASAAGTTGRAGSRAGLQAASTSIAIAITSIIGRGAEVT